MTTRPTTEQIAAARTAAQGLAQHVIDVMDDEAVTEVAQADLGIIESVLRWVEQYVTDPGRITVEGNPTVQANEQALLRANGIDTADVLVAEYERLGNVVRYRLRSTGVLVEQVLATDEAMCCVPVGE